MNIEKRKLNRKFTNILFLVSTIPGNNTSMTVFKMLYHQSKRLKAIRPGGPGPDECLFDTINMRNSIIIFHEICTTFSMFHNRPGVAWCGTAICSYQISKSIPYR